MGAFLRTWFTPRDHRLTKAYHWQAARGTAEHATGGEARPVVGPSQAPQGGNFRPDVEGLRVVAVVAVLLYHAGVPSFGGGYVGVDVFFVISGFLITGLLVRELEKTNGYRIPPVDCRSESF